MVKKLLLIVAMLAAAIPAASQDIRGEHLTLLSLVARSSETECLWINSSTGVVVKGTCPVGDITDVSFTLPSAIFTTPPTGSPCTTGNCAFTFALASQSENTVFARSTGSGTPTFQSMTKAMTPATTVHTDQINTFGAFLQTFGGGLTVSSGTTTTQALSSTTGTFSGAIAANGGSITSTAATLGIDAGGTINFVDKVTFGGNVGGNMIPTATDTYNLGSYSFYWNEGFISQLNAVLFAEATATLFGGYSIIAPNAGVFNGAVASGGPTTSIDFGRAMTTGHFVEVRALDTSGVARSEFMQVGALVSGTTYTTSRGLNNSNVGYAFAEGTPYAVNGTTGNGRIELNAYTSPKISIFKQGATYGSKTTMTKVGDLNGDYGFVTSTFGFGAGDYAEESVTIEPTDGFKIMNNGTKRVQFDGTNGLRLFKSDGSTVALQLNMAGSASFTGDVTAAGGTIGGWTLGVSTISATNLTLTSGAANTANITAGTGATAAGINSANAGGDITFWSGSTFANRSTAPFRVTAAGALTATNATVTGSIQTSTNCGSASAWCGLFSSGGVTWYDNNNIARVLINSTYKGVAVQAGTFTDIYDREGQFEFIGSSGTSGYFGLYGYESTTHLTKHLRLVSRNTYATGATSKTSYIDIVAQGTNTSNVSDAEATGGGGGAAIFLSSSGPSSTQTIAMQAGTSITLDGTTVHVDSANNRLGILDSTPSYALDVNGTIYGQSSVYATSGFYSQGTAGAAGTESSGYWFGGSGVAHGNIAWQPNEQTLLFRSGNTPTNDTDAYGAVDLNTNGDVYAAGFKVAAWATLGNSTNPLCTDVGNGSTGFIYRCAGNWSSRRYKTNIRSADQPWMRVLDIDPVWFEWRPELHMTTETQFGAIAEEVEALGLASLVRYENGKVEGLHYDKIALALIPVVKQQQAQIDALLARLAALERIVTPTAR